MTISPNPVTPDLIWGPAASLSPKKEKPNAGSGAGVTKQLSYTQSPRYSRDRLFPIFDPKPCRLRISSGFARVTFVTFVKKSDTQTCCGQTVRASRTSPSRTAFLSPAFLRSAAALRPQGRASRQSGYCRRWPPTPRQVRPPRSLPNAPPAPPDHGCHDAARAQTSG